MFASALAISPSDSIATTVNRAGAIITTGDDGTVGSITLALRLRAIVPCSALSLWIFVDKENKWGSDKDPTANYAQKTERVGNIRSARCRMIVSPRLLQVGGGGIAR